jgi:hypothetical protein
MVHHVLAFDLDGTLVQHVGEPDFNDPSSLQELCIRDREVQKRVLQLVQDGHDVHVVTARGRKVRDVTLRQVHAIHPDIEVHHMERFLGFVAMRDWKAKKLRDLGAECYVGDHMVDELAAGDAGIPFMHVDQYRLGGDLMALVGDVPDLQGQALREDLAADGAGVELGLPPVDVQGRGLGFARLLCAKKEPKVAVRRAARDHEGVHGHTTRRKGHKTTRGGR